MFKDSYQVIGVMSGTSLDGVDLVYVTLTYSDKWDFKIRFSETIPYSDYWFNLLSSAVNSSKQELLDLNESYTEELARIINSFIFEFNAVCSCCSKCASTARCVLNAGNKAKCSSPIDSRKFDLT